ncbi:MAG: DUF2029 domain-containing protein, partial [Candidatus Eremiobacteraeota bacterium]|nr:DUF2029 domain-containing protein [Candidatus Eremiobacteraeota bacterium]
MTARRLTLAAALAALAIAFFALRPPPTQGPALRDFEAYYAGGTTWRYHGDPYGRDVWRTERTIPGVVATRDELLPFVGPPYALPLYDALARLPWPAATIVWEAVLAAAVAVLAFGTLRIAGGRTGALDATASLVFVAGFGPLTSGIALGQAAVVACAGIVLVPLVLGPRLVLAATAAALAAALQPNLAIVLAARLAGTRSFIAFAFAFTIAAGGSLLALGGPDGLAHYADVLRRHAAAERFIAIQTSPAAVARALGATAHAAGTIGIVVAAIALAGIAAQCFSRRYAPNERLALACAAAPLVFPFAHEHDFTIAFLPALLVTRRASGGAWFVAACASLGIAVDWLGLAQRHAGVGESAALAAAAALALAALTRARLRPYHYVPVLVAAVVVIVGAAAAHAPRPPWAAALGAHVDERLDVAA